MAELGRRPRVGAGAGRRRGRAAVLALARLRPALPGSLVAVVAATVGNAVFGWGAAPIGHMPSGLPVPSLPGVPLGDLGSLVLPAIAVAALAALESLLSATVADGMSVGGRHDSDRELVGQGLANLVAPLFGGIPATAAIARTAVNVRSGATSRLAALTHSLVLLARRPGRRPLGRRDPAGRAHRGAHRHRGPDGQGLQSAGAPAVDPGRRRRPRRDRAGHGRLRPRHRRARRLVVAGFFALQQRRGRLGASGYLTLGFPVLTRAGAASCSGRLATTARGPPGAQRRPARAPRR